MAISYLALLRGINVGGNNIIKMKDLKSCFETMGFSNVETFIQSGNVLFQSTEKDEKKLQGKIEKNLSGTFAYNSRLVLVKHQHLKKVVQQKPKGFGEKPDLYRYDVLFVQKPLTADKIMEIVSTKPGVDTADTGEQVLYFSRLISKAAQSHLIKIIKLPVYQNITIRNWNTTTRLLEIMDKFEE